MNKKISFTFKLLFLFSFFFMLICPVYKVQAEEVIGHVTVTVEKFTIGQGYLIEPEIVPIYEGDNCAKVFDRLLKEHGYGYYYNGSTSSGFYLSGIKDADDGNTAIPLCIQTMDVYYMGTELITPPSGDIENVAAPDLSEFSYGENSGWMYTRNGVLPDGMSLVTPEDGDIIRLQYSVYGLGADLGFQYSESGSVTALELADKDALTRKIAEINAEKEKWMSVTGFEEKYNYALDVLEVLDSKQWKVDAALASLDNVEIVYPENIQIESNLRLEIKETYQIKPTYSPSDANINTVTYTSSNENVIKVDKYGILTPVNQGTATIVAELPNGEKSVCNVEVYSNEPVTGIISEGNKATVTAPARVTLKKVKKAGTKKAKLTWKKLADCSGYEVWVKKGKGKFKLCKSISSASTGKCKVAKIRKSVKYTFKVRAYKLSGSGKVYGAFSRTKKLVLK